MDYREKIKTFAETVKQKGNDIMHDVLKYNRKLDLTNPETLTKVRIRYLGEDYGKDYMERKLDHLNIRIRVLESGNRLGPHYIIKQDEDKNLVLMASLERAIPSILNEETLNHTALWAKDMENDIRWLKPAMERCFPKDRLIDFNSSFFTER